VSTKQTNVRAHSLADICSDKTGTLTQGRMVAKKAWIPARGTYSVTASSEPFNPTVGSLSFDTRTPKNFSGVPNDEPKLSSSEELLEDNPYLNHFLTIASLANLSTVYQGQNQVWHARGDPTEIAIHVFASRFGRNRATLTSGDQPSWKAVAEFPFDSDTKKMSVIFEDTESHDMHIFTKGAVERVLSSCSTIYLGLSDQPSPLTDEIQDDILANMESLAAEGLRVLALATSTCPDHLNAHKDIDRVQVETDLTFCGLIGLYDPPRPESADSVRQCRQAGIEVHMLTGDHPGTARAIAAEVGILPQNMRELPKDVADAMVMTAGDFDRLSDDQIDELPTLPLVVARCAPSTKVRMIEALHRRKKFVAMVSFPGYS